MLLPTRKTKMPIKNEIMSCGGTPPVPKLESKMVRFSAHVSRQQYVPIPDRPEWGRVEWWWIKFQGGMETYIRERDINERQSNISRRRYSDRSSGNGAIIKEARDLVAMIFGEGSLRSS